MSAARTARLAWSRPPQPPRGRERAVTAPEFSDPPTPDRVRAELCPTVPRFLAPPDVDPEHPEDP